MIVVFVAPGLGMLLYLILGRKSYKKRKFDPYNLGLDFNNSVISRENNMNIFLFIDPATIPSGAFFLGKYPVEQFGLSFTAFWVATLFEILTSKFEGNKKLLWALVVFLAPVIGIILYLIFGKNSKVNKRRFTPF